jgi:hypothetical protein
MFMNRRSNRLEQSEEEGIWTMNGNHVQRMKCLGIIASCVMAVSVLSAQTRAKPRVPGNNPSVPANTNPGNATAPGNNAGLASGNNPSVPGNTNPSNASAPGNNAAGLANGNNPSVPGNTNPSNAIAPGNNAAGLANGNNPSVPGNTNPGNPGNNLVPVVAPVISPVPSIPNPRESITPFSSPAVTPTITPSP